ncbi:MAG: tRNA (adenine(22)-N(1))-methyltransferase TrmK [Bdellovibrio sp.]|nr:tRNA (adenine(22)-N(1))-methyltransferase TrmK [Bdellovibrio sp.]
MIRLSERLTIVYQNLIQQKDVWDICCDHGYLGTAAYKSTNFSDIYFVDRVHTIMEKLKSKFQKFVFKTDSTSKAYFICTAGQNIETHVTGTLCITGVGGFTAFEILNGLSKNNFLNADRLILGPHRDEAKLIELIKNSLNMNQYDLKSEIKIVEKNIQRSLFILDRIF